MPANHRKVPSYTHHKASGRARFRLAKQIVGLSAE